MSLGTLQFLARPPREMAQPAQPRSIVRVVAAQGQVVDDVVAVEEPLEIRIVSAGQERGVTVTMRTPGHDAELAIGWLSSERIVLDMDEVIAIRPCEAQPNLVRVELAPACLSRLEYVARQFVATSSCGLCGKTSLEAVFGTLPAPMSTIQALLDCRTLLQIPARLRAAQVVFDLIKYFSHSESFTSRYKPA